MFRSCLGMVGHQFIGSIPLSGVDADRLDEGDLPVTPVMYFNRIFALSSANLRGHPGLRMANSSRIL